MRRKDKVNLLKFIVSLSLVVIFSGIAFDFENMRKLINPELDTYVLSSNKKSGMISITTIDKNDKEVRKNNSVLTNSSSRSNNVANDSNSELRNSMENKYGIKIRYGPETEGYSVSDLNTVSLTDENSIKMALIELDNNLNYYPENFFKEIRKSGFNLTIYLIQKYSKDDITGITDSTNRNVIISIAAQYQFRESIHHELYHYMERYMSSKGVRYTTWNSLNPANFSYGNTNSALSFNNSYSKDAYFVNNYAQTSADEDRASTFEYMTALDKTICLDQNNPIWLKAKYMCEQIDIAFTSVNDQTIEYWERFVY